MPRASNEMLSSRKIRFGIVVKFRDNCTRSLLTIFAPEMVLRLIYERHAPNFEPRLAYEL